MNVKVSEIFTNAGKAFNVLGDLILQVQAASTENNSKWSQEEVDMLKSSVTKFNEDLNNLSSHIKNKQTNQIRQTLKTKSYAAAGLSKANENVRPNAPTLQIQQQSIPTQQQPQQQQQQIVIKEQVIFQPQSTIKIEQKLPDCNLIQVSSSTPTSSQMTLNQLNNVHQHEEIEMDVEAFQSESEKIEYGSATEVS